MSKFGNYCLETRDCHHRITRSLKIKFTSCTDTKFDDCIPYLFESFLDQCDTSQCCVNVVILDGDH